MPWQRRRPRHRIGVSHSNGRSMLAPECFDSQIATVYADLDSPCFHEPSRADSNGRAERTDFLNEREATVQIINNAGVRRSGRVS